MQDIIERKAVILLTLYGIVWIGLLGFTMYASIPKKGDVITIDCRLSEISPDIPIWAKEACRKARMEKIDKEPK